jgi:hypothetical protein
MAQPILRRASGQLLLALVAVSLLGTNLAWAQSKPFVPPITPTFSEAVAFDTSPPLRALGHIAPPLSYYPNGLLEIRPEGGPMATSRWHSGDAARQSWKGTLSVPSTLANFEGLSNHDNFDVLGFRVNPPDSDGTVGPNHYVEEINLVFAIYD